MNESSVPAIGAEEGAFVGTPFDAGEAGILADHPNQGVGFSPQSFEIYLSRVRSGGQVELVVVKW